ncbi:MAG: hypothetical protein WA418_07345 [Bradyrhizobium sp.]
MNDGFELFRFDSAEFVQALANNRHPQSRLETWPGGEHTIYNYAAARNALAAG